MTTPLLEVDAVEKRFKDIKALGGLSFSVSQGEIFALLGPNGAGKTTMVRILTGILRPDQGRIHWNLRSNGHPIPLPAEIGYLPEERGLYKDVPIERTLVYFGILRGMARDEAAREARRWLERLGLKDRAQDKLETLSKGNQQKVQLASAVLHRPKFAVLDEPFSGLDPINQEAFLDLFDELRKAGMTILLSAHQMQLVERLADRILLIHRGQRVLQGTLEEIRRNVGAATRLHLHMSGRIDLASIRSHSAVAQARLSGDEEVEIMVKSGVVLNDLLAHLSTVGEILSVQSERLSLHDIYVETVRGEGEAEDKR